ncbi:MAG: phosphoglycerate kinase [Gemmatimonadota bacterium]|nr:MAG: phosphoglycerate kinase [Gemmatimonadota bacterium]
MAKQTIEDLELRSLEGHLVLVRADLNVPLDEEGRVADDTRLRRTLPTLDILVSAGARVVVLSHLGRPGGETVPALSLAPVAAELDSLLKARVQFCRETVGVEVEEARANLDPGEVLLLENTRFHPEERANDPQWAASLAEGAHTYVNDAFGAAHRAHASTEGVARVIRSRGGVAVAGLLMALELRFLGEALADPVRPFVAVLGGAKISGKIDVIHALLPRVDRLIIGGAMANTFLMALGLEVGDSLVEEDRVAVARTVLEEAGDKVLLPVDVVVAADITEGSVTRTVPRESVGPHDLIGDIGSESSVLFSRVLAGAETVVWNGPMGVFEMSPFAGGTLELARSAAAAADAGKTVIVGGGDSAAAAVSAGVADRLTHISTGGGAALELLAGGELPGVAALNDRTEVS